MSTLEIDYKTCSKCGELKLATKEYFTPRKNTKSGLGGRCKECRNKKWKERYANDLKFKEKHNERNKQYLENEDNRKKRREYEKKWFKSYYGKNPDKYNSKLEKRNIRCKERYNEDPEFRENESKRKQEFFAANYNINSEFTEQHKLRKKRADEKMRYIAKTFGPVIRQTIDTEEDSIYLWLAFDIHYGNRDMEKDLFLAYLNWMYQNRNVYAVYGGDVLEMVPNTVQKHHMLGGQSISMDDQFEWLKDWLGTVQGRNLCWLMGNHEGRVTNQTEEYFNQLANENFDNLLATYNVPYCPDNNVNLELVVNGIKYDFILSHGHGGSRTPDYIIRKMFNDGMIPDTTDFLVVGHTHHNYKEIPKTRLIKKDQQMMIKKWIGIRPGTFLTKAAYLRYQSEMIPGNVILQLSTRSHNYRLFDNLDDLLTNDL
jgi:hypothetical protein